MKHSTIIASVLILLVAGISIAFLAPAEKGQENAAGNQQRPLFAPAPGSPINVVIEPGIVVIGDMNKDGKQDLVVTGGKPSATTVLLGKGDGQFSPGPGKPVTLADVPGEVALGDVNSDGNLDVALVSHDSYGVTLLLGDSKGSLTSAPNSPVMMKDGHHPHTHGLALSDLNGDGKLDLATVNNSDNDISVSFGDGRGGFKRAPATFVVGPSPYPMALGDVNNDHHIDIVATATATGPQRAQQLAFSRALTLLLSDGRGEFQSSLIPLRTGQPWSVAIGDVNGDGKVDLLATHHDQSKLTVLLGDGRGGFTETQTSPIDSGGSAFELFLSDVNHDGKLDVMAAVGDGVRVMLGDGRGGFTEAPRSPFLTGRGTWGLAAGDVNGDRKTDLVTANGSTISVLLGQ